MSEKLPLTSPPVVDEADKQHEPPAYKPKERINPKTGLQSMIFFLMDIRLKGRMRDGQDADETWTMLTPSDLEKLEDIADTLEFFRLQREQARLAQQRRANR